MPKGLKEFVLSLASVTRAPSASFTPPPIAETTSTTSASFAQAAAVQPAAASQPTTQRFGGGKKKGLPGMAIPVAGDSGNRTNRTCTSCNSGVSPLPGMHSCHTPAQLSPPYHTPLRATPQPERTSPSVIGANESGESSFCSASERNPDTHHRHVPHLVCIRSCPRTALSYNCHPPNPTQNLGAACRCASESQSGFFSSSEHDPTEHDTFDYDEWHDDDDYGEYGGYDSDAAPAPSAADGATKRRGELWCASEVYPCGIQSLLDEENLHAARGYCCPCGEDCLARVSLIEVYEHRKAAVRCV